MPPTAGNPELQQPPAVGLADLRERFGDIRVRDGAIVSPPHWESTNCITVRDFPGLTRRLYVNRAIVSPLREALCRCIDLGDGYSVKTIGCFNPRPKRVNGAELSLHSWALAVDINAATNPMRKPLKKDIPDGWIAIFETIGWTWGGRFPTPDAMHFQWCSGY